MDYFSQKLRERHLARQKVGAYNPIKQVTTKTTYYDRARSFSNPMVHRLTGKPSVPVKVKSFSNPAVHRNFKILQDNKPTKLSPQHQAEIRSWKPYKPTYVQRAWDFASSVPSATKDVAVGVAQGLARDFASTGLTLTDWAGKQKEYTPTDKMDKILLGEEPVKSFRGTGEEMLKSVGLKGDNKYIATAVGGISPLLDVLGGGGEKSGVKAGLEAIAKTTIEKDIGKELVKMGVEKELIPTLSKTLKNLTKPEEVKNAIKSAVEEFKGIKPPVKGEIPKNKITLEQVSKEAKEYPNAGNFSYIANRKYGISSEKATEIWNKANKKSVDITKPAQVSTFERRGVPKETPKIDSITKKKQEMPPEIKEKYFPAKDIPINKGKAKDLTKIWRRNILKGQEEAQSVYLDTKSKLGEHDNFDTVLKHEKGEAHPKRGEIEGRFENMRKEAEKRLGIEVEKRKNYVPQVYKNSPEEVKRAVGKYMEDNGVPKEIIDSYLEGIDKLPEEVSRTLGLNPFFKHERVLPDYNTAMKYGITPKYDSVSQLTAHYWESLKKIESNQQLVRDLVENGEMFTAREQGTVAVNVPYSDLSYYAKPKTANYLNDVFRVEEGLGIVQKGIKYGSKINKALQELVLSGGIPKTNLNFYTFGVAIKDLTAGLGNLATLRFGKAFTNLKGVSNFIRSNFNGRSIKWFAEKEEILNKMAGEGIDISRRIGKYKETNRGLVNFFKKSNAKELFGGGFDRLFNEKTFNSYMPMQATTLFEDTFKSGLKKGLSEDGASKLAGDTVKKFMGLSEGVMGKTNEELLGATFFAPRFRESLINTYWNTLKSASPHTWADESFSQNRSLLAGMILSFGAYDYYNYKMNGKHLWDNPTGHEGELMVKKDDGTVIYVPFMPSQTAFFRNMASAGIALGKGQFDVAVQKAGQNFAMGLKTASEVISNRDYFGNQIYDPDEPSKDKLKDIGMYVGLNLNHPFVKGLWNLYIGQKAEEQSVYPAYQKIQELEKIGDREGAKRIIDSLSKDDKDAYYEIKKQKIKPLYQILAESTELPLKFSTVGKIKTQEYFENMDKLSKSIKATESDEEKKSILQSYIKNLPESERKSVVKDMQDRKIFVDGLRMSDTTISAQEITDKILAKDKTGAKTALQEAIKKDPENAGRVAGYIKQYLEESKMTPEEIDLKGKNTEERAQAVVDKMNTMKLEDKKKYLAGLIDKKIVTDKTADKMAELMNISIPKTASKQLEAKATLPEEKETISNVQNFDYKEAQTMTDVGSGIVAGYNIKPYATAPTHERDVADIYFSMPEIKTAKDITDYIDRKSNGSPITGKMIVKVADKYDVDPKMIMAIIQKDSSFGTKGKAVRTKNAGNWGNDDSGNLVFMDSWEQGIEHVAKWLKDHEI